MTLLLGLIVILIAIGLIGIHRRQPQLVLVASLGLVLIIIGMLWVILLPDPSGAVIIK